MPEIIDIIKSEIGTKCEQQMGEFFYGLDRPCIDDAICAVIYDNGKQKFLCKKHLRIELNKEIDQ